MGQGGVTQGCYGCPPPPLPSKRRSLGSPPSDKNLNGQLVTAVTAIQLETSTSDTKIYQQNHRFVRWACLSEASQPVWPCALISASS